MSESSETAGRPPRVRSPRRRANEAAGETVIVRGESLERRTHTIRELAQGDGERPRYRYRRPLWHAVFAVIDALGSALAFIARLFVGARAGGRELDPASVRSILLIQLDHLGDGILTCAVLPALSQRFAQARITALVGESCADLFRLRSEVDEVLVCERHRFARDGKNRGWMTEIFRQGRALRSRTFDVAIDVRGEFPHALLMWLAGAKIRIGWSCGGGGFLLTHSAPYTPQRHEVLSRWAVVKELGVARPRRASAMGPKFVAERVEPARTDVHSRRVVCHLGAGTSAKRWPAAHWKRLVAAFANEPDTRITLVGGPAERELAESIVAADTSGRVESFVGTTSLADLLAHCSRADLVVGADSGPAHLAAAANRPTLTLFSGTNDVRQWRPWGEAARVIVRPTECAPCHRTSCPIADHPCLAGLSVEVVLAEALSMLYPTASHGMATELEDNHASVDTDDGYPRFPKRMYRRVRAERGGRGRREADHELASADLTRARGSRPGRMSVRQTWLLAGWAFAVGVVYLWCVVGGFGR